MKLQRYLEQCCQWGIGIVVGFVIANTICFAYERQPGWYDTPMGASAAVRNPYSYVVHGTEGYSISKIDRNGYTNPDKELAESYVLMMGASHSQGKEIAPEKKYSVLVNNYYADDNLLHTYNIACDGSYLPSQIKHFKAAVEAFPNADVISIEILNTDYSVKQLEDALIQPEYDASDSAIYFSKLSIADNAKIWIKSYIPMLSRIKNNIEASKATKTKKDANQIDDQQYEKVINEAMALIRSESNKPIVFIYHPGTNIESDGSVSLEYGSTWDIFKEACDNNGIDYIDSGADFINYYNQYHKVPYGFWNTSLGTGHLNEVGHRIIADEIIEYLEGLKQ